MKENLKASSIYYYLVDSALQQTEIPHQCGFVIQKGTRVDILKLDPNEDDEYLEDAEIEAELEEEAAGIAPPSKFETFTQRKSFKAIVAAATLYTLVLIGETIGAFVTLNNAENFEFGQGVLTTVGCDDNGIKVTALSKSDTSTSPISFKLQSIKLSEIADACINKTFKLAVYDGNNDGVNVGYNQIVTSPASQQDAKFVKVIIKRTSVDADGIDWRVFPATSLPNPLSESGLTICGGQYDLSDTIDYNFGTSIPKPGCPKNNYLTHWRGYITLTGTDDGQEHDVLFSLLTTGEAILNINNQSIINGRGSTQERTLTGVYPMFKGMSYPIDLWVFKSSGVGKTVLDWDVAGDSVVPASAFQYDASLNVIVATSEGTTDYSATANSFATNAINFSILFPREIPADSVKKFVLETK